MANNRVQCGEVIALVIGAANLSGYPVVVGHLSGVALKDGHATKATAVALEGVFDLSVKAVNDSGNSAVAIGDRIYIVDGDTPKLSKKATGKLFGWALEPITSGSTDTINVLLVDEGDSIADASIVAAKLANGSLETVVADPGASGAIPVTKNGNVQLVSAGSETRTLADPTFAGQQLLLGFKTKVGNIVVTAASAVNLTGNNTITFSAAGQACALKAVAVGSGYKWRLAAVDGAALSTV